MEYRIRELNGEFTIQAKKKEYELYWWFGWKEKNIKYVWRCLDMFGHPRSIRYGRFYISIPLMDSFKTLKKANKKIKELEAKPKYHDVKL